MAWLLLEIWQAPAHHASMNNDTRTIYNEAAQRWERREPQSLSDFTGRPPVFALCGDVKNTKIADLGCGEGYCARVLYNDGAEHIDGIDISEKMVERAIEQVESGQSMTFQAGTVTELPFESNSYDLAIGVFVYNYLTAERMIESFHEVYRILKPGAAFVFSVPHPAFPFIKREQTTPFFFNFEGRGYFSARNERKFGEIHRRDGQKLPVEMTHKLLSDYFGGLKDAGFTQMPEVHELGVKAEHLELDEAFFAPVNDIPLHMAIRVHKD